MTPARHPLGLALGLAGVLLFAATLPAMKLAIPPLAPTFFTMARAALGGGIAVVLLALARRPRPAWRTLGPLLMAGLCLVVVFPLGSAIAMQHVPAAHGAVVLGVLPLATAVAASIFAGERPAAGFWITGMTGTALVVGFVLHRGGGSGLGPGDLGLLVAVVAAAIGYTFAGRLSRQIAGWETICWALVLMLPLSLPATWLLWPPDAVAIPAPAWGSLAFNTVGTQLVGFFLWNAAMAIGGIARIGQLQLLQPFIGIALAGAVNGEAIDAETVLVAAAVVGLVMLGQRMRVGQRRG